MQIDFTKPLELMDGTPVRLETPEEMGIDYLATNPDCDGDYWIVREEGGYLPDGSKWWCVTSDTMRIRNRAEPAFDAARDFPTAPEFGKVAHLATSHFPLIRTWAQDRNLIAGSTPDKQMLKLVEEFGELGGAMARGKLDDAKDAIGDMIVVLTILAAQQGFEIEECIALAWNEIKDRKGRMIDGVFVKESEL